MKPQATRQMKEINFETKLRRAVAAVGGLALKMPAGLYAGIPDRLLLLPGGRFVFVELKTDRGRVSLIQKVMHNRLAALGAPVEVVRPSNWPAFAAKYGLSDGI